MFELTAGIYEASHAGLRYELALPLHLPASSCLLPRGDNGVGKTTFLEHVFMEHFRRSHRVLYLAQDMHLQVNTMRATLALMNMEAPLDPTRLAAAWIRAAGQADILVLDEFDKYLSDRPDQEFDFGVFPLVVSVTHLDIHTRYRSLRHGFALHFHQLENGLVRLEQEQLW